MNTKHLLLAATATAFVALNFTSCKEDEFDLSFENCVEKVSPISISDGDTIRSKTIGFQGASAIIKDGLWMVRCNSLTYIGLSKDKMKLFSGKKIDLQPFVTYYIESTPYIVHDNDTVFGEKQEIKFYSIPKTELVLTADYGDGDIAANIHWKLRYYYEEEDKYVRPDPNAYEELQHTYYDYDGTPSAVNVSLITSYDTTYSKDALDFPVDVDSCYIKQGGTYGKPDYPAYIYRYWKDGKTIMYYDPVIYDFCFNIKIPLGEEEFSVKDTIRSILMDKSNCVCDYEFNIYRTTKIGNKVWTIDNFRGHVKDSYDGAIYHREVSPFYGRRECLYESHRKFNSIQGYHVATENDWNDLENFYGIVYPDNEEELSLTDRDIQQKLFREDSSLQKYFSTGGAWFKLLSAFGWQDDNGDFVNEQGAFNAIPAGFEVDSTCQGINGSYKHIEIKGVYRVAVIHSYGNNATRIISRHYEGIAKCAPSGLRDNLVSIRFVKD